MVWTLPIMMLVMVVHVSIQDMVTMAPSGAEAETTMLTTTEKPKVIPVIRALHITSDIKYRYATTLVSSRVVNPSNYSGEAAFTVTLPESAFISEFLMDVKGKVYKAYVKEKEEAKSEYNQAVQAGHFAGHVALDARDSNQFTVSVNVEAHGKVTFNLTYEELLARKLGVYTNVININPQQIVEDMSLTVNIEEPTAIIDLEVPELQMSNEAVPDDKQKPNALAKIEEKSPNHKQVIWAPTPDEQKSQNNTGVSGQFIVKYDVDRTENPQQILVDEGYFVHFFAPENLPKLRKHVVFVLDYSGSMAGRKLEQLKDAMHKILSDLDQNDYFSVVIFHSYVEAWSPKKQYKGDFEHHYYWGNEHEKESNVTLDHEFVVQATPTNIDLAHSYLVSYSDLGATNIIGGLRTGLKLVTIGSEQWVNESDPPQPVVVFLTDGQPNVEESDTQVITEKTKHLNLKECPIFSLAFGYGADFNFLRKLSLSNFGFARNIYEAADASDQLKNFYRTIASPLLSNVTFTYLPGQVDNSSNTKRDFPVYFKGSELVVAGKIKTDSVKDKETIGELSAVTANGTHVYPIVIQIVKPRNRSLAHLEKVWAYLTIQQLLDKSDSLDKGEEKNQTKQKALDLALQYSFVTPLTSLVVVKPNETESSVDTTKVRPGESPFPLPSSGGYGGGFGAVQQLSLLSGYPSGGGGVAYPASASFGANEKASINHRLNYRRPVYRPMMSGIRQDMSVPAMMGAAYISSPPQASRLPFYTTTFAPMPMDIIIPQSESSEQKVTLNDVMWLHELLSNSSGLNSVPVSVQGHQYNLALNETDQSFGNCQVNSKTGECHHFQFCALSVFKDKIEDFIPYQCSIAGDFLGVCCPVDIAQSRR